MAAWLRPAGCDCAILGCTERAVYRALHSLPPYYMDAMEVLAEQAILRCGKQLRNVKTEVGRRPTSQVPVQ